MLPEVVVSLPEVVPLVLPDVVPLVEPEVLVPLPEVEVPPVLPEVLPLVEPVLEPLGDSVLVLLQELSPKPSARVSTASALVVKDPERCFFIKEEGGMNNVLKITGAYVLY